MSTLSPGTLVFEKSLSSTGIILSKRFVSKDTIERNTGDMVEHMPKKLPTYGDT